VARAAIGACCAPLQRAGQRERLARARGRAKVVLTYCTACSAAFLVEHLGVGHARQISVRGAEREQQPGTNARDDRAAAHRPAARHRVGARFWRASGRGSVRSCL
jgi:hypothetical protein